MDPDEPRRGGGPRRAPVSRQGRRQPASRRTARGRAGGARRPDPSGRAPRPQRPVPPPRAPFEDDAPAYHGAPPYHDASPYDDALPHHDEPPYHDVPGGKPKKGAGKAKQRSGKPKQGGRKAKQRGKPAKGRPARPANRSRPASRKGGLGPKLYFGAAAVLGVLVLLGLGAVVVLRGGNAPDAGDAANAQIGTPAGTGLSPDSYSSSASTSAYSGIASRRADPDPLTIKEVFPSSAATLAVPDGEVRVKLRAKRLDGDCAAAVWGATVGEVLGEGGCTQAARGIYSGTEDGYALAVAVFNLAGSADADRFVATLEKTIGAGFVQPLEAPAPLDDFGRGFGMARGLAMGHFAVVTWAQRLDGKGDAKDEAMLSLLIEGGKNPAVLGRAARASD